MIKPDTDRIRSTATWLNQQSVSSNADSNSQVTKRDLEHLRDNVAQAIAMIADILDD